METTTDTTPPQTAAAPGSALPWTRQLGIRIYEAAVYHGWCSLPVDDLDRHPQESKQGGKIIAEILVEAGMTEQQAESWFHPPQNK